MIKRLPKQMIEVLRAKFLDEQLFVIMNDFLIEQCRCQEALYPEENWYYALFVLDRLHNSKRMEIEINLLRSDIEEDLSQLLSPAVSCHATLVLMWCVYFMLRTYADSKNSPYKALKKSLERFLYDDRLLAAEVENAVLEMELHEERNGRFVPYMDYMEHAVEFLADEAKSDNRVNLPFTDSYPKLFNSQTMPAWRNLQKINMVDENFMRPKTRKYESAYIANCFRIKYNVDDLWNQCGGFWNLDYLAQAFDLRSFEERHPNEAEAIKKAFGIK